MDSSQISSPHFPPQSQPKSNNNLLWIGGGVSVIILILVFIFSQSSSNQTPTPATISDIPVTSSDIPVTSSDTPVTSSAPATSSDIPVTSSDIPVTSSDIPATSSVPSDNKKNYKSVPGTTRNINRQCCPENYSRFGDICREGCPTTMHDNYTYSEGKCWEDCITEYVISNDKEYCINSIDGVHTYKRDTIIPKTTELISC